MSDAAGSAAPENTAAGPGQRLRAERERRGFTQQKVAEDLHLDQGVIEALEAGRFAQLGPPVYARGHLRKYAALLGLDGNELLAAYEGQQGEVPELRPLRPKQLPRRRRVPLRLIAVVLALILAAACVWWVFSQREADLPQGVPAAAPLSSGEQPAEPATDAAGADTTGAVTAPTVNAGVPLAGGTARLRLSFKSDSWAEVFDANGRRLFFDLGLANSARSLTGAAPLRVFLGFADGVQLELNGRPLTLPSQVRSGNLAHFTVDANGQLRAAAEAH